MRPDLMTRAAAATSSSPGSGHGGIGVVRRGGEPCRARFSGICFDRSDDAGRYPDAQRVCREVIHHRGAGSYHAPCSDVTARDHVRSGPYAAAVPDMCLAAQARRGAEQDVVTDEAVVIDDRTSVHDGVRADHRSGADESACGDESARAHERPRADLADG